MNEIKKPVWNLEQLDMRDIEDAPTVFAMLFNGKTHEEIAEALGVERSTCTHKIHRLVATREFQNALRNEWVQRYTEMVKEDPRLAFKQLSRLVATALTRHIEAESTINMTKREESVTVHIGDYERQLEEELVRALRANRAEKPVDTAQAAP